MKIFKITDSKKQYLPLLLLADEEEAMLDRHLTLLRKMRLFPLAYY